ncbi:hypothetical protein TNCT_537581 [Trichonephila clavata]|uniref:Uncharacterized protein n=1 Tax=Trichonephila clavata TaxID=2740835 RepID=A0A8X6HC47_TRICU|nr:hypothetical protein TNCT_537581 [Trichonephila clavata]
MLRELSVVLDLQLANNDSVVKAETKRVKYKSSVQIRTTFEVISATYTCPAGGTPTFQYTCFKRVFKKVKISFLLTKTGKKIHVEGVVGQNVLKVASENDVGIHEFLKSLPTYRSFSISYAIDLC